jgi:hypothetical protein
LAAVKETKVANESQKRDNSNSKRFENSIRMEKWRSLEVEPINIFQRLKYKKEQEYEILEIHND